MKGSAVCRTLLFCLKMRSIIKRNDNLKIYLCHFCVTNMCAINMHYILLEVSIYIAILFTIKLCKFAIFKKFHFFRKKSDNYTTVLNLLIVAIYLSIFNMLINWQ